MQLLKLTLNNFQGIKEFTFEPNGSNANIFGTNASGKTTIYNAFTWLLFDKPSTGAKNFSPKTKDENGNDIHYLDNSVEGVFRLDDGRIVTFKKVFREEWTKKRNSLEEYLSGNKTDYFYNGIPVLKCDYDSQLNALFTPVQAQVLTQPTFFAETMPWTDRRKLLLEVCGDITDQDVIAANKDKLGKLPSFLLMPGTTDRYYTVDEYRKIAKTQCEKINQELKDIPGRIDEATRAMPDISNLDQAVIEAAISALKKQKEEYEEQKAALSNTLVKQEIQKQIADLTIEGIKKKSEFLKLHEKDSEAALNEIAEMKKALSKHMSNKQSQETILLMLQDKLNIAKAEREKYEAEYKQLRAKEWQGDTICPTCGQPYPAEHIEKVKANFNEQKAKRLEEIKTIVAERCSKEIIAGLERDIEEKQYEIEEIAGAIDSLSKKIQEAESNLPEPAVWENTPEYAALTAQMEELKKKLADEDASMAEQRKTIQAQIDGVQALIDEQNTRLLLIKSAEKQKERIAELEKREKQLSREYERLEEGIYLCEEFIRLKVSMLTDKINSHFKTVKFKLIEDQINGGLKECCEVMARTAEGTLVPYPFANNAARINAGLEVIDALSKHWGISLPVFIDNAESVVNLQPIDAQVIRLVVSEQDACLRVEVA